MIAIDFFLFLKLASSAFSIWFPDIPERRAPVVSAAGRAADGLRHESESVSL